MGFHQSCSDFLVEWQVCSLEMSLSGPLSFAVSWRRLSMIRWWSGARCPEVPDKLSRSLEKSQMRRWVLLVSCNRIYCCGGSSCFSKGQESTLTQGTRSLLREYSRLFFSPFCFVNGCLLWIGIQSSAEKIVPRWGHIFWAEKRVNKKNRRPPELPKLGCLTNFNGAITLNTRDGLEHQMHGPELPTDRWSIDDVHGLQRLKDVVVKGTVC